MLILALVSSAFAFNTYPFAIAQELEADCVADCTVCHETQFGGLETVDKPFGLAMMDRGLTAESGVTAALAAVAADELDQDGDGVTDVDELRVGDNPNALDETFCDGPQYGCFSHAPVPTGLIGLGIAVALATRRQRIATTS